MSEFRHNKGLGQNFLSDGNLLTAIVADAEIVSGDTVLEVGAGLGALTLPLTATGASVVSYEIDRRLIPRLEELAAERHNLRIVDADIMTVDDAEIAAMRPFKVVANLPYYITTPVLFKFIDCGASSITVMVQKEVAERLVASPGGKDYGVLSVMVQLAGKPRITRRVGRNMFTPPPNVDSAVVRIDLDSSADKKTKSVVRAAFSMRRKTLVNCLSADGFAKDSILTAIAELGFPADVRGERLSPKDFVRLAQML